MTKAETGYDVKKHESQAISFAVLHAAWLPWCGDAWASKCIVCILAGSLMWLWWHGNRRKNIPVQPPAAWFSHVYVRLVGKHMTGSNIFTQL